MHCVICKHGTTAPGHTTVTLERSGSMMVVKRVPADLCQNCGEAYISQSVAEQLYQQTETRLKRGVEFELETFAA